jgi:hypothetical protein
MLGPWLFPLITLAFSLAIAAPGIVSRRLARSRDMARVEIQSSEAATEVTPFLPTAARSSENAPTLRNAA